MQNNCKFCKIKKNIVPRTGPDNLDWFEASPSAVHRDTRPIEKEASGLEKNENRGKGLDELKELIPPLLKDHEKKIDNLKMRDRSSLF